MMVKAKGKGQKAKGRRGEVGSFCAGALEMWRGVGFCGAVGR
jgi:hypothetical protein